MIQMKPFKEVLKEKKFIVTAELFPPKGIDITQLMNRAKFLSDYVDAFNVTDSQRAIMRLGPLAICHKLKVAGYEPIYQLTCRDRNRIALQSDLLQASLLGIENILILSGDHPFNGDHKDAKPVYDLDPVTLLRVADSLRNGRDMNGTLLNGKPTFLLGAVVNPSVEPLDLQLIMMKKKIESGASFFQTQITFDINIFKNFYEKVKDYGIRVLFGVLLLKSYQMAENLNKMPGINIPQELIERLKDTKDPINEGITIVANLIEEIKMFADGVHIMAINAEEYIPEILKRVT
ncbi:MAG: methylenetetrahydrofolate reductase [Candidatus Hydrogenedentota bacterium]